MSLDISSENDEKTYKFKSGPDGNSETELRQDKTYKIDQNVLSHQFSYNDLPLNRSNAGKNF